MSSSTGPSSTQSNTTESDGTESHGTEQTPPASVVVTVSADGPYVVSGPVEIRTADGRLARTTTKAALCRCGHSGSKPFCDGSHRRVGFSDPGPEPAED